MKPIISDACIICGTCETICPAVFKLEAGAAKTSILEADYEANKAAIDDAISQCPVTAISWGE